MTSGDVRCFGMRLKKNELSESGHYQLPIVQAKAIFCTILNNSITQNCVRLRLSGVTIVSHNCQFRDISS